MKKGVLCIMWVSITIIGIAQVDSLLKVIDIRSKNLTTLQQLYKIADTYEETSQDSALKYYSLCVNLGDELFYSLKDKKEKRDAYVIKAKALKNIGVIYTIRSEYDQALENYFHSLRIFSQLNDLKGQADLFRFIGIGYFYKSEPDMALKYYKYSMNFAMAAQDTILLSNVYANIGIIHHMKSNYDKAMEFYLKQMKLLDNTNEIKGLSACYVNLANVYKDQRLYTQAIAYYKKAIPLKEQLNDKIGLANIYNNLGIAYAKIKDNDQAISYYFKSIALYESLQAYQGLYACYNNIGSLFVTLNNYSKAVEYYNKAKKLAEQINVCEGDLYYYSGIAQSFVYISDSLSSKPLREKYLKDALVYAEKLKVLAIKQQSDIHLHDAYNTLFLIYKRLHQYDKAFMYNDSLYSLMDKYSAEKMGTIIAEMQTKYETEKKQLQIDKLDKENKLKQLTLEKNLIQQKRQQQIIYFISAMLFIIILSTLLLVRWQIKLRKANRLLAEQKALIEEKNISLTKANEEIRLQKEEIIIQRDTVSAQKQELELLNKKITDSIVYASYIQQIVLPELKSLHYQQTFDAFWIYKPKDIVSGDFYWFYSRQQLDYFAVADCTGHGVSGALLSMLGISLLNEYNRYSSAS